MLVAAFLLLAVRPCHAAWTGEPTPLDQGRLVVVRPADVAPPAAKVEAGALFGQSARFDGEFRRPVSVKFPGAYTLWVRVTEEARPIQIELLLQGKSVLSGAASDGAGSAARGGREGYHLYRAEAERRAAERRTPGGADADLTAITQDLDANRKGRWIDMARLDALDAKAPRYWWNVGAATLEPGLYELRLQGKAGFDAAFLTTSPDLTYPFGGDVAAPPASYLRFRIDEVPPQGLKIAGHLRVHYGPAWGTEGRFNPEGLGKEAVAHKKTGFTRWYSLQQLDKGPPFGATEGHLTLDLPPGTRGATQFAVHPHGDAVLREFDWSEPEGTRVSLRTDFENHLGALRTLRDHAYEHYEYALAATEGKLFPLTRGPLWFGNAWGAGDGVPAEYMARTLRLLGMNCVAAPDPAANRRRYGWTSHAGRYWPPSFMPFDEKEAAARYADALRDTFKDQQDLMAGVSVYQMADEPGEVSCAEMTAPLWKFLPAGQGGPQWIDPAGSSELRTRRTDYHDCVLEGTILKLAGTLGFQVATDDAVAPRRFGAWHIGHLSDDWPENVALIRDGKDAGRIKRPGADFGKQPTAFKIVYEGDAATLLVGGQIISRMTGLARQGGFGLFGPSKAIAALAIRPIRKDESGAATPDHPIERKEKGDEAAADLLEDLGRQPPHDWAAPKPLEAFVKEDWVQGGGIPGAHGGFRRWAQAQGLEPALFGRKSWDEVGMLTLAAQAETEADRRLFYWSRRYSGALTPRMFSLAAEALRAAAPNREMLCFAALSGGSFTLGGALPLDMFQLASYGGALVPGISDWNTSGQAVAYSAAFYNAGARVPDGPPRSFPMMHCVWPSALRSYVMLGSNVKYVSFYNFGPSYAVTSDYWCEVPPCYAAAHLTANRAAQVDDILAPAALRPSRVALLYAMSNEYWDPAPSFADKRATFLGLAHEGFQPELVTEDQVAAGDLGRYDALYVADPMVTDAAQKRIADWVRGGGLLWTAADAAARNEYREPDDLLAGFGLARRMPSAAAEARAGLLTPADGEAGIRRQTVPDSGIAAEWEGARVRARYGDGRPAWLEKAVGKGLVVYHAYRCGLSYSAKAIRAGAPMDIWADTGREQLVLPLKDRAVSREVVLSEPAIVASPMTSDAGTVIILYNMRARAAKNLGIALREPARPASVQVFKGTALVDLPYEYRDGCARMTLAELDGGQMVVVRRRAAPPDARAEALEARAAELLASSVWQDVAAGAWQIGFFPAWGLADRLTPLLAHDHFAVRAAAAESVGRLGHKASADALVRQLAAERDAHALGQEILALGFLGDARFPALAAPLAKHPQAFVRRQALRGAVAYLVPRLKDGRVATGDLAWADPMWEAADRDADARVADEAGPLLAILHPDRCAARLKACYVAGGESPTRQGLLTAVCANEAILQNYLGDLPAAPAGILDVASRRQDARMAAILKTRLKDLVEVDPTGFMQGAAHQADPALTREIFAARDSIPPKARELLPWLLDRTFGARLGNDLKDWEEWLVRSSR